MDGPVGDRKQAGEDIAEVGHEIEAAPAVEFDDGVKDGATLSSLCFAKKQPVLLAQRSRTDDVFDEVVIDLKPAVLKVDREHRPI